MAKDLKSEIVRAIKENADSPEAVIKKPYPYKIIVIILITILCAISSLYFGSSLFSSTVSPTPPSGPYGKIHSPVAGSVTNCEVKVTAETKNLEPGQYVWLAVDKPEIGLSWPKSPRLEANISFSTLIYEEGKKEPYTLSLYVINKTTNDNWQQWLDAGKIGGLTMPPDKRRLDSVRLILGK